MIRWYQRYRHECLMRGDWWFWAIEHHPGILYLGFFHICYWDEPNFYKTIRRYSFGWNRD